MVCARHAVNLGLWWYLKGSYGNAVADTKAMEFLTGYLIEKSLAVDNIFVFLMIFTFFAVPAEFQRRVLIYGVIGAIVMRAIMILAGAYLVKEFHWILYLFGAFLVITGVKMLMFAEVEPDLNKNPCSTGSRTTYGSRQTIVGRNSGWLRMACAFSPRCSWC